MNISHHWLSCHYSQLAHVAVRDGPDMPDLECSEVQMYFSFKMQTKNEQDKLKYFSIMVLYCFISAVLIHSESVCGSAESVECDKVAVRRD